MNLQSFKSASTEKSMLTSLFCYKTFVCYRNRLDFKENITTMYDTFHMQQQLKILEKENMLN